MEISAFRNWFSSPREPNNPADGSRAYTNPWIVENRYEGHVELIGEGIPSLPWPPTNMVLFAEKRMGKSLVICGRFLDMCA